MSTGVQVLHGDGVTVTFDSRTAQAGTLPEVLALATASVTVRTYPDFSGYTVSTLDASGYQPAGIVVDYALGYPRITIPGGLSSIVRHILVIAS